MVIPVEGNLCFASKRCCSSTQPTDVLWEMMSMLTLVDAMYDWSRESRAYREAPGEAWSERDGVRGQRGGGVPAWVTATHAHQTRFQPTGRSVGPAGMDGPTKCPCPQASPRPSCAPAPTALCLWRGPHSAGAGQQAPKSANTHDIKQSNKQTKINSQSVN